MATSLNDARILAAIDKAMAWEKSQVGKANARSVWAFVYKPWANTNYAWCGGFQAAAYLSAGVDLLKVCWWFYTPYIKNFAVKIGAWKTSAGSQNYGDMPLFDWQQDGVIDHVGAAWPDAGSSLFRSIEGNTSVGNAGSQGNGGQCAIRYRSKPPIMGWVNMRKVLAYMIDKGYWDGKVSGITPSYSTPAAKKTNSTDGNYLVDEDGDRGSATNSRWQQVMGTPIDGRIDKPSACVKKFQSFLNAALNTEDIKSLTGKAKLDVDGYAGAATWKAYQFWFAVSYPDQMKAICGFTRSSNNNRFWTEWTNGVDGAWTQKSLQWVLNRSWANTGVLGGKTVKPLGVSIPKAASASKPSLNSNTAPDGAALLDVDGSRGTKTISRWQQVMGTPIDGRIDKPSACVKKFQRFLNSQVSRGDIRTLTGSLTLDTDGYAGVKTWKVYQFWFANKYPNQMKAICGFTRSSNNSRFWNEWTNGIDGVWTYKSLQWILNRSYAGSGKLGSK